MTTLTMCYSKDPQPLLKTFKYLGRLIDLAGKI